MFQILSSGWSLSIDYNKSQQNTKYLLNIIEYHAYRCSET
jgi:hypothetical protein